MIFALADSVNMLRGSHEPTSGGCILHTIQSLDNVFGLTKSRISGWKFFGSGCEHSMVSERRFVDWAVLKEWTPRQGKSP